MLDWALNTFLNTIKKNFPGVSKIKLMTFSVYFQRLTFPANNCQRLRRIQNLVKHSTMELFREIFFFSKIHKKKPVLESHINKVTGLYTAILLKERTPTQVFSGEFSEIPETFFTEHLQVTTSVLQKKDFINKIVKSPLIEGEKNRNGL